MTQKINFGQQVGGRILLFFPCNFISSHSESPAKEYPRFRGHICDSSQLVVNFASCVPCPAGTNGGLCQQIFALLLVLERYSPESESSLPGPLSCTSEKETWDPGKEISHLRQ